MVETLKFNSNYEIEKDFPHRIRRIGKDKFISEFDVNGYVGVYIDCKQALKHRLIALQFIQNDDPENKIQVDHINRIKSDNRLENLRWVTSSENIMNSNRPTTRNRQKSEYLDELPPDAELIEEYNDYEFDRYFYDLWEERIVMETKSKRIKILKPFQNGKVLCINLYDTNGKKRNFGYNKLIDYLKHNY